jgi:hypothetical protein
MNKLCEDVCENKAGKIMFVILTKLKSNRTNVLTVTVTTE